MTQNTHNKTRTNTRKKLIHGEQQLTMNKQEQNHHKKNQMESFTHDIQ